MTVAIGALAAFAPTASAQEEPPPPQCPPVPGCVEQTFDTAGSAMEATREAPQAAVDAARDTWTAALTTATEHLVETFDTVDYVEDHAVRTVGTAIFGPGCETDYQYCGP